MVWVVAVVLWGSSGDADVGFTDISGTRGLKLASVVLLRGSADPIVVIVAFIAADPRRFGWGLGESHLPLVAHLGGFGVSQDFRASQDAVAHKARGSRAGDVVHLLAGRGDVNGEFRTA